MSAYQINGYHVDQNGKKIEGRSILKHENGKLYEPVGTGLYLAGDGYLMSVWALDKDEKTTGIAGTSVTFIDTRDVKVMGFWERLWR